MYVGIASFTLLLYEGASLKDKRMVVKSLIQKISSRYNVSIAETGEHDKWQRSEIGFSCVSNERRHVERMLQEIIRFAESDGRGEIMDIQQEIL